MSQDIHTILGYLRTVDAERERRASAPELALRVHAVKAYQQQRFMRTYADLLASPRYAAAANFFLDELYGPKDYSQRDAQFARVVPALVHLFPQEIVDTVKTLGELHALSETLDTEAAQKLASPAIDASAYARAWLATGRPQERDRQIDLTLSVGESLDHLTRNAFLRHSLRLMRAPARAAGLGELQRFLESGFDTFKAMSGASEFLATIGSRERALARDLFAATFDEQGLLSGGLLGQLP